MKFRKLGNTDIEVSLIGLGTMTWGEQNTEKEAHEQLDHAISHGINFIDTAEMYPVPPRPDTQGLTEAYIGSWLSRRGRRDDIILATKAAGPARQPHQPRHLRGDYRKLDRRNLSEALHASLKRLNTDYVDLYQLHWPDRTTNTFGQLEYPWVEDDSTVPILETLEVLADFIREGKVRHIGVSNETPWGVSQFLQAARYHGLPHIVSIQNPYNLVNRSYEIGLAEFSHREGIGLLAYSPLGFGVLSGKYVGGKRPPGTRITLFDRFVRYSNPETDAAVEKYVALADEKGISPAQLALAFINSRPFVTSNLIGATNLDQLEENIRSIDVELDAETLAAINAIHKQIPNPAP